MIDPKKAKQLGCSSTCPVPLRVNGETVTHDLPCTPHDHGLCVVLVHAGYDVKKDTQIVGARMTHIASGFALGCASYPATKAGVAAALYELAQLLPLTDWTKAADELTVDKLTAEIVTRRCRAAFPGKLVGNVVTRDIAQPPAEIVKWRVYSQDTATGEWFFVDLAHEDHLLSAVDEALTKTGTFCLAPVAMAIIAEKQRHAFDFDRILHTWRAEDLRVVVVERNAHGFDLVCAQRAAMVEALAQAERDLAGVDNPRKTLGVWKSGPKFGQLKLSGKLHSPSMCLALLAVQDRYDAQARKVEALRADLRHLETHLAESEPIPERVTKLCPRETPNGHTDALALLGFLRAQEDSSKRFVFGGWTTSLMFDKCVKQLEKQLHEYESVAEFGFAPRSRCIFVGDPRDGETDCEVEIEDVIVSRGDRWSAEPVWWHERDVVFVDSGDRSCVAVSRLRAKES